MLNWQQFSQRSGHTQVLSGGYDIHMVLKLIQRLEFSLAHVHRLHKTLAHVINKVWNTSSSTLFAKEELEFSGIQHMCFHIRFCNNMPKVWPALNSYCRFTMAGSGESSGMSCRGAPESCRVTPRITIMILGWMGWFSDEWLSQRSTATQMKTNWRFTVVILTRAWFTWSAPKLQFIDSGPAAHCKWLFSSHTSLAVTYLYRKFNTV